MESRRLLTDISMRENSEIINATEKDGAFLPREE